MFNTKVLDDNEYEIFQDFSKSKIQTQDMTIYLK